MKIRYMIALVAVLAGSGCKSDSPSATSDALTGTFRGKVFLYTEQGGYAQNSSGVTVQIEGTPYSAITDSTGSWEIKNLPTRTCSISFSKLGYLTWKNTSYVFIGGGILSYGQVYLKPTTKYQVTLDAILLPAGYNAGNIYGHVSPKLPSGVYLRVSYLASHKPTMNIDDSTTYSTITEAYNYYTTWDTLGNFQSSLPSPGFNTGYPAPFTVGDTMYVQAYGYIYTEQYYDIATDKQIVTGYGKGSNVLSGIVK
jgi:hypothetical protein